MIMGLFLISPVTVSMLLNVRILKIYIYQNVGDVITVKATHEIVKYNVMNYVKCR